MVSAPLGESREVLHRRRLIKETSIEGCGTDLKSRPWLLESLKNPGIRESVLGDIPEDVLRFLTEKIETVPHLEVLLLLAEDPTQCWTVEQIASRIYTTPQAAGAILKDLQQRQLVSPDSANPPRYCYDSAWDAGAQLMPKIMQTYRRRLVQVASFIHSKASSSVREFARAFDFKKDR